VSRILSQEEVEALLKGVQTGKISTEQKQKTFDVKPYDFREAHRPLRVSPGLDRVFQRFGLFFRNSLSGILYKSLEVLSRPSEYVKFNEFLKMVPVPSSVNIFRLAPLNGNGLFILEQPLVFTFVELFFGSQKVKLQKIEPRPFTSMEERVIKRIALLAMRDLQSAWKDFSQLSPEFIGMETSPEATGIATPSETVIKTEFQVNVDEFSGKAFMVIPFSVIEPIADQLLKKGEEARDEEWIKALLSAIMDSELEIVAELARLDLSFGELLTLKPGDVFNLGRGINDEIPLKVQGIKKFSGVPGNSRGNQAVRITTIHL